MANIKGFDMGGGTGNASRSGYYVAQVGKPPITTNKSATPAVSNTNNYDWGSYTTPTTESAVGGNSYADYLSQLQAAREEAIAKANAAIDEQTRVAEKKYNDQMAVVNRDFDDIGNQSEVKRFKAKRAQREALANQGRLDGGAGRMEETVLRNNYDNNLTKINIEREAALNDIRNAIAEMKANAGAAKAQNLLADIGNYANALMYGLSNAGIGGGYSYSPNTSANYMAAQNLVNSSPYTTSYAVNDGRFSKASTAQILKALEDQWSNASTGYYRGGGGTGNFSR